jgi:uncharacterized protein YvpB
VSSAVSPPPRPVSRTATRLAARRRAVWRRRIGALLLVLVIGTLGARALQGSAGPDVVVARLGDRDIARIRMSGPEGRRPAVALARTLPSTATVDSGGVETVYQIDRERTAAAIARAGQPVVEATGRAVATSIRAPVIAQALRNNCETAALQVLLATTGVSADQLTLQDQLAASGPLDPVGGEGEEPVWGDPDEGYVGRADGSGPAGGFGVYPGPIAQLAARYDRRLEDLTGASVAAIHRRLLAGRAVMAWVGLGDGPYRSWRSPSGRPIRVNLNEHTVVLTGVRRDGSLSVVNVLEGTRETWSRAEFERDWELLGRRALGA